MPKKSKVVVVAEDDAVIRANAAEVLTDAGFEVVQAGDAADAIAILEARGGKVSVLFTDIHMPGQIDGLELAYQARVHWPGLAVLVASGKATPKVAAMPRGVQFLPKPYRLAAMVNQVRELAGTRR